MYFSLDFQSYNSVSKVWIWSRCMCDHTSDLIQSFIRHGSLCNSCHHQVSSYREPKFCYI